MHEHGSQIQDCVHWWVLVLVMLGPWGGVLAKLEAFWWPGDAWCLQWYLVFIVMFMQTQLNLACRLLHMFSCNPGIQTNALVAFRWITLYRHSALKYSGKYVAVLKCSEVCMQLQQQNMERPLSDCLCYNCMFTFL